MHYPQHPVPWNIHGYNAIDLKNYGLPEVPLVGIHGHLATKKALNPHRHEGSIEIHYIGKGNDDYWVEGKHFKLRNNDVIVTYPHEEHSTGFLGYGRQIYWIQVKVPRKCRTPLLCLSREATNTLSEALWSMPRSHFEADSRFSHLIEDIFITGRYNHSPTAKVALANHVSRLLLLCIEWSSHSGSPKKNSGVYSEGISRVIKFIKKSSDHSPDTKEMAELCGLSISAFKARFRKETGIPPKEFALREMVDKAKKMLEESNEQITSIGLGLGFSSSQYFATVFKRFTGLSPLEFRNKASNNNNEV